MENNNDLHFDTLAVRAGQVRINEGEHAEPIFPTSSFGYVFISLLPIFCCYE